MPPVRLRSSGAPLHLVRWWTAYLFMEQKSWGGGGGRKNGPKPSLNSQAPGCLHPMVQDLRCRETVKARTNEPIYDNDLSRECRWSCGALPSGPPTHLTRQSEGVVGFNVRLDRAGIVLFYVSSPLVLYNCNKIYACRREYKGLTRPLTFFMVW